METGYQVPPVIDRNYFWAIYFPTPNGVLFEIARNEPSFDVDEDTAHFGESLKLQPGTRTCPKSSSTSLNRLKTDTLDA